MKIKNFKIKFFLVFILVFLSSALFIGRAFVYDAAVAHAGLTKLAGELYNREAKIKLTQQEIAWLTQGSVEEDTPLRWMNHFYDPVNNKGLNGMYDSAKVWAKDYNKQTGFAKGNNTWQEAIYQYQKGNKDKTFMALGHILHLMEDMTVPAHTRDDAHPEGDPYEVWVKNNFKNVEAQVIYYSNLNDYFNYLANFSNNNFFSKDTINSYSQPKIFDLKEFGNYLVNKDNYRIISVKKDSVYKISKYFIDDNINQAYFSLLAPKAVGAGAGVIKLFFEEAQKPQQYDRPFWQTTPLGLAQEATLGAVVPEAEKILSRTKEQVGNLWSAVKDLGSDATSANNIFNFVSELWQTQQVLARDLKDLEGVKNNLSLSPVKLAVSTGQNLQEAMDSVSAWQVLQQLDASGNGSATAKPKMSVPDSNAQNNTNNILNEAPATNVEGLNENNSLESGVKGMVEAGNNGFSISTTVYNNNSAGGGSTGESGSGNGAGGNNNNNGSSNDSAVGTGVFAENNNGNGGNIGSGAGNGTGNTENNNENSSAAENSNIANSEAENKAGDNTTSTASNYSDQTNNQDADNATGTAILPESSSAPSTTELPESPDVSPPLPPQIIYPDISPFFTTSTEIVLEISFSTNTVVVVFNNQPLRVSSSLHFFDTPLEEGENDFSFIASDTANNQSATTSMIIIKDTTAPSVQIATELQGKDVKVSWSADDGEKGSGVDFFDVEFKQRDGEWQGWFLSTTSTEAFFASGEGEEYIFRVRATDKLNTVGEWEESVIIQTPTTNVVINEIAWGGTRAAGNDEWLELYNASGFDVDLGGWVLTDGNDINIVFPTSTIKQDAYFLLERTNDATVSDREADLIFKGSFFDGGEKLTLKNSAGVTVDEVNCSAKWFAGRNAYDKETMERKSVEALGSDAGNWQNSPMAVWQNQDAKENYIAGTPGSPNSAAIYLNGELSADTVLSQGTYALGILTVPSNKTLTISAGVKIVGGLTSNLKVFGKLKVLGAPDEPVIFTSYKEISSTNSFYLQDVNWGYLQVLSGGEADLQNAQFNYGNSKLDNIRPKGLIYADNGVLNLDGVVFDKNLNEKPRGDWPLINSLNSVLEIKNSQFLDSPRGLIVRGGSLNLSGNTFDGLGLSALESEDLTAATIENNTFKNLGWEYMNREYWNRPYPLLSPVSFKNFLPEKIKGNIFENDILNSWEVYGRLEADSKINTLGDAPALMGLLEIPAGVSLEIKEGSIIKVLENLSLKVFGSLLSRGTEGNGQIIFTSLHDDEYGGDVDLAEGRTTQKEGNEWVQILIQSTEPTVLNHTLIRFANAAAAEITEGSVFVGGAIGESGGAAPFSANDLTIEYSRVPGIGLHLKDATGAVINGCLIRNENKRMFDPSVYTDGSGIWINGGDPEIADCVIDTFNFGIRLNPESHPHLSNIEYKNVDFEVGL